MSAQSNLAFTRSPESRRSSEHGSEPEEPSDAVDAEMKTVLVVDDDLSVLRVAAKVLQRGGFNVLEANSGGRALEVADSVQGQIDLLLTDVVMPRMNGRELSEALLERYPEVRVLFMSAYTQDEVILQGVRVAEVNFISKPFTVEGLRNRVREVIEDEA